MIQQHVDHILEEFRLLGVEVAAADLFDCLPQLRETLGVLAGVVPAQEDVAQGSKDTHTEVGV